MTEESGYWGTIAVVSLFIIAVLFAGCMSTPGTTTGSLQFSSSPQGAQVYLDNEFRGTTPVNLSGVNTGVHFLEYRYPGYMSWNTSITVMAGPSTYFAALTPLAGLAGLSTAETVTSSSQGVSVQLEKDLMVVGNSQEFSGTGTSGQNVLITLYGPGKYQDGVMLPQTNVDPDGVWRYRWNPGTSVQAGSYSVTVTNSQKTSTARAVFRIIGGGLVSVATDRATYTVGTGVSISGRCTTGAQTVFLTLYGPGQFANGVGLGAQSVTADKTWNFRYMTSSSMPIGMYTITAQDAEQTSTDSASFSIING